MKHAKKLLALALAFAMALALAVPAFALTVDEDFELPELPKVETGESVSADLDDHSFELYQIFAGKYEKDAENNDVLAQIQWGSGFGAEGDEKKAAQVQDFLAALKNSASGFEGAFDTIAYDTNRPDTSADAVARVISKWPDLSDTNAATYGDSKAKKFADIASEFLVNPQGTVQYGGEVSLPGGYYLVKDVTDLENAGENAVANMFILEMSNAFGNKFNPTAKADVPELKKNVLEINDSGTLKEWGVVADYDAGDTVYFVLTGTLPTNYDEYETYTYTFHDTLSAGLTLNSDPKNFHVYFNGDTGNEISADAYALNTSPDNGESFTLSFANLKDQTSINAGSTIQVVYSATLNADAITLDKATNTAHLEFSNNPNPQGTGTPTTGNTPDDTVTVFTFKLVANKVDEQNDPLAGAGFTLYKKYANPPAGATKPDDVNDGYYQVGEEMVGNGLTEFTFKGLDAGEYMLRESTVPAGYNRADDMYFTITATYGDPAKQEDPQSIISLTVGDVKDKAENVIKDAADNKFEIEGSIDGNTAGTLTATIVNLRGLQLPSTGGIGTTIFYVVGGLLLVGAAVVLITKKRMSSAE